MIEQRVVQRAIVPGGVVDVRRARDRYARAASWADRHTSALSGALGRRDAAIAAGPDPDFVLVASTVAPSEDAQPTAPHAAIAPSPRAAMTALPRAAAIQRSTVDARDTTPVPIATGLPSAEIHPAVAPAPSVVALKRAAASAPPAAALANPAPAAPLIQHATRNAAATAPLAMPPRQMQAAAPVSEAGLSPSSSSPRGAAFAAPLGAGPVLQRQSMSPAAPARAAAPVSPSIARALGATPARPERSPAGEPVATVPRVRELIQRRSGVIPGVPSSSPRAGFELPLRTGGVIQRQSMSPVAPARAIAPMSPSIARQADAKSPRPQGSPAAEPRDVPAARATPAAGETASVREIAERVTRSMLRQLAIERERRGGSRWP